MSLTDNFHVNIKITSEEKFWFLNLFQRIFAKKNIANFEIEIMNDFIICNAIQMK